MSKIIFTRDQARVFVDASLSAASTDDITPVICGAYLTQDGDQLRIVCTDRYRAHTALISAESFDGAFGVIIPRQALSWLSSNIRYYGSYDKDKHRVIIEIEGDDLALTVTEGLREGASSVRWAGFLTKGTFPSVIQIIEKARAAEPIAVTPRLRPDFIGRVNALGRHYADSPIFKFTASDNPNKPGPVYIAFAAPNKAPHAEAVIQPNLMVR